MPPGPRVGWSGSIAHVLDLPPALKALRRVCTRDARVEEIFVTIAPDLARNAFYTWSNAGIPLRFLFIDDSASAEVHLRWVDRFPDTAAGKTFWARDVNWWILGGGLAFAAVSLALGLGKVAPFYYYPGFWEGGPQLDFYVNDKAYNGLSAELKAIVEAATAYAHVDMQAKYDARNPNALRQLVGSGTKLREFPKDVMAAAFKEAMKFYDEISARNENWKKVYADYSKFRAEQNLWFRFTEASFDSFMQAQKL